MKKCLALVAVIVGCNPFQAQGPVKTDEPAIVPVTEEQVTDEKRRLDELEEPDESKFAILELFSQATARYHSKPMVIFMAGTDSMNGGVDDWRTCAKLKPEQLGLPADTLVVFFDEYNAPCAGHPDGYVTMMTIVGPAGIEESIVDPVYKTEKMTVMIASILVINENEK
ncbi:hypothetical protein L6260_03105 [Candidatus Parcubacteria bacterium]|nr:hypothetical protein [Candidatus Parcubacteria bacterium]